MNVGEEDYLMISGIQHFLFCRRQWALIHVEQQWADNEHTVAGDLMHKRAHDPLLREKREDMLIVRALPVSSKRLGISGECDIVEFHRREGGIRLYGHRGEYLPYPVEYKKGRPKTEEEDILQLSAQVLCLEEMFSTEIPQGALFYGETRRRETVEITEELRERTEAVCSEMRRYYERGYTPKVKGGKKCRACSLKEICLPELEKLRSVRTYIENRMYEEEP